MKIQHGGQRWSFRVYRPLRFVAGPDSSACLVIYRDTEKCTVINAAGILQKGK